MCDTLRVFSFLSLIYVLLMTSLAFPSQHWRKDYVKHWQLKNCLAIACKFLNVFLLISDNFREWGFFFLHTSLMKLPIRIFFNIIPIQVYVVCSTPDSVAYLLFCKGCFKINNESIYYLSIFYFPQEAFTNSKQF